MDDVTDKGDVHVIRNNRLQYVVLSEERYQVLIAAEQEAYYGRIKVSLKEVKAGKVKKFATVDDLLKGIETACIGKKTAIFNYCRISFRGISASVSVIIAYTFSAISNISFASLSVGNPDGSNPNPLGYLVSI